MKLISKVYENVDTLGIISDAGISAFIEGEGGKDLSHFTMYLGKSSVSIDTLSQLFFKCKQLKGILKDLYVDRTDDVRPSYMTKIINLINY